MKKALPYILLGTVLVAALVLIFSGKRERRRVLDEHISFRKKDKIPYGTFVAWQSLPGLFPRARVITNDASPGNWDSLSSYESNQALIIISPVFFADEFEMKKIIRFVESGNEVFISTAYLSEETRDLLSCRTSYGDTYELFGHAKEDTLRVSLQMPPFSRKDTFVYPGRRLESYFTHMDTAVTTVLGNTANGSANFIHLRAGEGNLYIHLSPMAFTNYFLLTGNNLHYLESALSVISPTVNKVVWDEYFLTRRPNNSDPGEDDRKGWLSSLLEYPEFKWAILTALITLLVFVLLEMRRRQRPIPVISVPRNESLDFVKTIGRLYFDKGDHTNLGRKMAAYFLEHVRNRYKLGTRQLDDEFIRNLVYKSGGDETVIRSIVFFIRDLDTTPVVTEHQLAFFHKQLELFYGKS